MWFFVCGKLNNGLNHVLRVQRRTLSFRFGSSSSHNMGRFSLYKRISPLGDPKFSILPVLDEWVREGNSVNKQQLRQLVKELTKHKRFGHALEVSQWMSGKMLYDPSPVDLGSRVCLISRVHGLEKAEEYFHNIPESMKSSEVFSSLLNCYTRDKSAKEAEKLMKTMKDMGISVSTLCYNIMMNMYYQMNAHDRLDALMLEMEQNRVPFDQFTLSIRLSAYAAVANVEGIEKTVESIDSLSQTAIDWSIYSTAADAYLKVKLLDKAIAMLKKYEELVNEKSGNEAFHVLLKLYAKTGRKEELCRIWFRFKAERRVYNRGYMTMIDSALKLDDVELAEKVFNQWESGKLSYDFRIPNLLIHAYCEKGLIEKAEQVLQNAKGKGVDPSIDAYSCLASKYLEDNEISKAREVMELAISAEANGQRPLEREMLSSCLRYIQGKGDGNRLGEFMESLRSENVFTATAVERLHHHLSTRLQRNVLSP